MAEKLFAAQVTALGVEVTDAEIDSVIADVKKLNGLDDAQLDQALIGQGMDRVAYRKAVKRDLESMRLVQLKIRNKVKVTDEDVKNYWQTHPQEFRAGDEVRIRHVFLALSAGAGEAEVARVRAVADKVVARARAGEDFAQIARQVSEGPSAADGGELGLAPPRHGPGRGGEGGLHPEAGEDSRTPSAPRPASRSSCSRSGAAASPARSPT